MKRHPCCSLIPLLCGKQEGKNHPPAPSKSLSIISSKQDCLGRGRGPRSLRENWGQSWLSLGMENIAESINIFPFLNSLLATPLNHAWALTGMTVTPQQGLPWEPQLPEHWFASPSSSHTPASLHITHWELSSVAPALCGASSEQQILLQRSTQISFQGSALCEGHCAQQTHPHCLFIPNTNGSSNTRKPLG